MTAQKMVEQIDELSMEIDTLRLSLAASSSAAAVLAGDATTLRAFAKAALAAEYEKAAAAEAVAVGHTSEVRPGSALLSQQTRPWRRSLRQTAVLLRLATCSSSRYIFPWVDPWEHTIGQSIVSELQRELIVGVDSAIAAAAADGQPVDIPTLMEWLQPLLYQCVQQCVILQIVGGFESPFLAFHAIE